MRKLFTSLTAAAFLAVGFFSSPAVAEDIKYHPDPNYSDFCDGGDCPDDFVPLYSYIVQNTLCGYSGKEGDIARAYIPSATWEYEGETFTSPTCRWNTVEPDGSLKWYIAVAFDTDGSGHGLINSFSILETEGALKTPTNASIISQSWQNFQDGIPVYYSFFQPDETTPALELQKAEELCALGTFEPLGAVKTITEDGQTIGSKLFAPHCTIHDDKLNQDVITVIMDERGKPFAMNIELVGRLLANN